MLARALKFFAKDRIGKQPAGYDSDMSAPDFRKTFRAPKDWFLGGWVEYPEAPYFRGYFEASGYVIGMDRTNLDCQLPMHFHFVFFEQAKF